jgi:hypothetical protein
MWNTSAVRANKRRIRMRRPSHVLVSALVLGLFSCSESPTEPDSGSAFSAKIANGELHLTLPLEQRANWEWNLAGTAEGELEYKWTGIVTNGSHRYELGFFKWKLPGSILENGTFEQLLQDGQSDIFELDPSGAGVLVPGGGVAAYAAADSLVLRVNNPESLALLTSEHPTEITLTRSERGEMSLTRTVPLVYQE